MPELTRDAHKVIVPVLPSDIDIHAASRCIADLLLVAKIKRAENRIGVIANRVRKNTLMFQSLMRFLEKLDIPVIATIRDSQNYVRAAEQGVGIHEMKPYRSRKTWRSGKPCWPGWSRNGCWPSSPRRCRNSRRRRRGATAEAVIEPATDEPPRTTRGSIVRRKRRRHR